MGLSTTQRRSGWNKLIKRATQRSGREVEGEIVTFDKKMAFEHMGVDGVEIEEIKCEQNLGCCCNTMWTHWP